ncbi:hypothetical protein NKR23_g3728 [Pleurostoma richardsiae]|uniref:Protein HRI1 n=1 Tax=Pleurostoma richardsiae TaxID=41990 RepID=A0AA38VWA6_9PEZI|nr:hypothetical protein NKR23_g3728 [Pleurostoma richardsiae]
MGSISTRSHIRWLPDPASEPTSTLVLTSPGRRFVDVRVLKPALRDDEPKNLSPDQLDWAFGGTSESSQRDDGHGGKVAHSTFQHWVDSRAHAAEQIRDEGDMFPQPDGTTLETGKMVNPATGVETDYEEVWKDEEPIWIDGASVPCTVLQLQDDDRGVRGMVVRLGQYCQGVMREGDDFTAERWEWRAARWALTARVGNGRVPCSGVANLDPQLKTGDALDDGDYRWKIVERT